MSLRHTSIRVRVFLLVLIPLLATIGIYAYAVAGQLGTAVGLANAGKVSGATIRPMSEALVALTAERGAAVGYLVAPSDQAMTALRQREAGTDEAARVVDGVSKSGPVTANASPLEKRAAARFVSDLGKLGALRSAVAGGRIGTTAAINSYSAIMSDGIGVAEQAIQETYIGQSLAITARAEVKLYAAAMLAAEEGDLYSADIATGRMPVPDQIEFAQLAGLRRYLMQDAVPQLDSEATGLLRTYVPSSLSAGLTSQENLIIGSRPGAATPPVALSSWQQTVGSYSSNLVVVLTKSPNWIQSQVVSSARSALTTLVVAASAGLLAVIASIVFSLLMGRRLVRRLTGLRQAALDLAHERLPNVLARLRSGETVDVEAEAPPVASSVDEIDQVKYAFTVVHRAAVQAAVEETNLRRGVSDVFRNLARRNQALLHRQLSLLDGMERRAEEPEQLEDLFRIDHLTTRMRRHAEGLIILSGDSPGRSWSRPVPFIDVLRAAVSEVEDYTRIRVEVRTKAALAGHAVADVVHLLAELVENATVFSPPGTNVRIQGELVGRGFAIEVEDRGLGLSGERLAEINRNLADVPAFDLASSDRLGLFITARLAHRHDIKVTLRSSPYGGTTAIVIIPIGLVVADDSQTGPLPRVEPLAVTGRALPAGQAAAGDGYGLVSRASSDHAGNGHHGAGSGYPGDGYPGTGYAGSGSVGNGHDGNGHHGAGSGYPGDGYAGSGSVGNGHGGNGHHGAGSGYPGDGYAGSGSVGNGHAGAGHHGAGSGYPGDGYAGSGPVGNGHAGTGHHDASSGYPGNGYPREGYPGSEYAGDSDAADGSAGDWYAADGYAGNGSTSHGGYGTGHAAGDAPSERWSPRHSAGSSEDSGWWTRPSADSGRPADPAQAPDPAPSDGGLPVRVRQASLAPELRGPDGTAGAAPLDGPPASAEAVRSTMSALQRGWELGRNEADPGSDAGPLSGSEY